MKPCSSAAEAGRPSMARTCTHPRRHRLTVLAAALGMLTGAVAAQTTAPTGPVGAVLAASGTVILQGAAGAARVAGVDAPLQSGDRVLTEAGSSAELRYADGTRVLLGPRSSIEVPQFRFEPARPDDSQMVVRLLRGAMRVVTGTIARQRPANARFLANTATIGIRGTDFTVRACDGDCRVADDATVARAGSGELAGRVAASGGGLSALDLRGQWRVLGPDAPLREGDLVITGNTGVGVLVLRDGTRIALDPDARLWIAEMRWDEARPREGRIRLQLLDGAAQVATGALAQARPERFELMAGAQPVRVLGTSVAMRPHQPSEPGNPALALPLFAVGVQQGAVELPAAQGPALRLGPGQAAAPDVAGQPQPQPMVTGLRAPDVSGLPLDAAVLERFFGASAGTPGQPAPDGVYVHVRDGAVELEQGGRTVVLTPGESGHAPPGSAPPAKVSRGVLVAGPATLGVDRFAGLPSCTPDPQSLPGGLRPPTDRVVTAADVDIAGVLARIRDKLRPDAFQGVNVSTTPGKGGLLGAEFGPGPGLPGTGPGARGRDGAAREGVINPARVTTNVRGMITGWAAGSFHGEIHNSRAGPPQLMGGMRGNSRDQVSAGRVSGGSVVADSGSTMVGSTEYEDMMSMYGQEAETRDAVDTMIADSGINTTGNRATDTAELVYFMMVGSDGYEATRNMSAAQRQAYWAGQAQAQRTGADRPRDDENFTAGGSGLPIYIGAGQFGNEIRALGRALDAVKGRAGGGKGDGRGDRDQGGGISGRRITTGEQLGVGVGRAQASGGINWSVAFPQNIDGPRQ